ncbi:hypothetical protein BDN72DRAFT_846397 [Pluteus cervinus]|uniref:Uncharacterized protein n=1 Tax=Pluteus cervinus TaxID=181527 RepID=A0ACD3AGG3_9AGAR|nr:hypothetical protein BDN72DRAFT_846397 [Pluteus cervinus]
MEERSGLSPDGQLPSRMLQLPPRPPSLAMKRSFPRLVSPGNEGVTLSTTRGNGVDYLAELPLRRVVSNSSMKSSKSSKQGNKPHIQLIHAPIPRRHLLNSSASHHWLHTPPLSPTSSRGTSPVSTTSAVQSSPRRPVHKSFSSLLEHEQQFPRRRRSSVGPGGGVVGFNEPSTPTGTSFRHDGGVLVSEKTAQEKNGVDTAMGRKWVRWMHKKGIKEWTVPSAIAFATLVKLCISLGSYSGKSTPPMYGDYEAQRHWMELTLHLPFRQWYTYDLQYWGLDYPPLTAYVSWICGIVASWINPSWVALDASRGIETEASKVFMRMTVLAWDLVVYIPALLFFAHSWQGTRSNRTQIMALLILLLQPALLLIDFGHFQYNSVMLGFTLLAINFFTTGKDLWGAVCFVLSLGFKQMALYYAPAIGSYLLAKCIYLGPRDGGKLFLRLAMVTIATFTLLFIPFLPPFAPLSAILDPITRIFPFARGLFEDKVANFWCASNVVIKWKAWASSGVLIKVSTILTALGFLPAVFGLLRAGIKFMSSNPTEPRPAHPPFLPLLPYAMLTSSMSFFLFSFQVHEKTILLPLMPMTLLLSGASSESSMFAWGALVNNVAVFSMWPLLKRDGLGIQYIAALLLWNRLIGYNPLKIPRQSFIHLLSFAVYIAIAMLHILEVLISPPARYPDLFPVLNVLVSTPVFVLTWLWSIKCGVEVSWALGGPGPGSAATSKATAAEQIQRRMSDSNGSTVMPGAGAEGVVVGQGYRQLGMRAMSLGYAQSRRRPQFTQRGSSVGLGEVERETSDS